MILRVVFPLAVVASSTAGADDETSLSFEIERTVIRRGFDGTQCWVHARAGAIPPGQHSGGAGHPLVVMTMQKLLLSGSDVFYGLNETRTSDMGNTWSDLSPHDAFKRQQLGSAALAGELPTGASIAPDLLDAGDETTVCDFTPKWHAATGKLLGTGHTVWYRNNRVMPVRPRGTAYAVYEPTQRHWSPWKTLQMPDEPKFHNAGAGCVQRVDLAGGDILLPVYFKRPKAKQYSVTVCRCRFDGKTLRYVEHGSELTVAVKRGLYEPSITRFGDRFFLTMRNDDDGYVSVSHDGLTFPPPRRWTFDDGRGLGNYNTQQHWVTHSEGLFLVYTRRGANNDHVFRHRAPLFIARVDTDTLQIIRATEQVLVPERGARLGNFSVVDVTPNETWVTVTEWMQPADVEKRGSDNRVYVAKIKWDVADRRFAGGGSNDGAIRP